jgi:hypothetical protein
MFERCVDVPGTAANIGASLKDSAWRDLVEAQGDTFIPLCHEMPGIMGEAALVLLDQAAARFSSSVPQRAAFKAYWLTRLHVANIRGVAETIQENLPFARDLPFGPRANTEFFVSHPPPFPEHFDQASAGRRPVNSSLQVQQQWLPTANCPVHVQLAGGGNSTQRDAHYIDPLAPLGAGAGLGVCVFPFFRCIVLDDDDFNINGDEF